MKLTTEQLTKILFQADDRITKDILSQQSRFDRWTNDLLSSRNGEIDHVSGAKGYLQRLQRKLTLVFTEEAKLDKAHPRSLANAMRELRALGYSNEQIFEIRDDAARFTLSGFQHTKLLPEMARRVTPNYGLRYNDDAFLGTMLIALPEGKDERDIDEKDLNSYLTYNTAFLEKDLDELYPLFRNNIASRISHKPDYLVPKNPQKALIKPQI